MTRTSFTLIAIMMALATTGAHAQDDRLALTVFGTVSKPMGAFSEMIGSEPDITRRFGFDYGGPVGLATAGYGCGIELQTRVLMPGLSWVISGKVLLNGTDVSQVASTFEDELGDTVRLQFTNGQWLNIPLFTGFAYSYPVLDDVNMYAVIQGGVNLTRQASRTVGLGSTTIEEVNFNLLSDFGYEVGLGAELFEQYNVTVRYADFGKPRYDGTRKLNESFFNQIARRETYMQGDSRPVSMITVSIGYRIL